MKLPWILKSEGCYSRSQYILTDIVTTFLIIVSYILVSINIFFLILAVPLWLLSWYIYIIASIKRLHDLGRSGNEVIKLLIPIIGTFMDMKLWYESGQHEQNMEAYNDYKIQQYNRKHRKPERPHEPNRQMPRRYGDF